MNYISLAKKKVTFFMNRIKIRDMSKLQLALYGTLLIDNKRWGEYRDIFIQSYNKKSVELDKESIDYINDYVSQYIHIIDYGTLNQELREKMAKSPAPRGVKRLLPGPQSV